MFSNRMGMDDSWSMALHEIIPAVKMSEQILGHQEAIWRTTLLLSHCSQQAAHTLAPWHSLGVVSAVQIQWEKEQIWRPLRAHMALRVTALWSHSQQNSIPKPTDFHENIFNLIQIRKPVSLPSYFQTKAPLSQQMLKMVKTISHVDWKVHKPLWWLAYPPGFCSPRRRRWRHCYALKYEVFTYVSQHWCNV